MSEVQPSAAFNYAELSPEVAARSRERAVKISSMMVTTVTTMGSIGLELLTAQEELGHGKFLRWIESELRISSSSAYRFMDVARSFGDKLPTVGILPVTVVQKLAEKSTPEHVRSSVIDSLSAGERPSVKTILDQVREAKAEARRKSEEEKEVERRAALSLEERAREDAHVKRSGRNKAVHDKRRAEGIRTNHEEQCLHLQMAREAARVIIENFGQDSAAVFFQRYRSMASDIFAQGADAINIIRAQSMPVTEIKWRILEEQYYLKPSAHDELIIKEMAEEIRLSGECEPLVVLRLVDNRMRSYRILEGIDRFRALRILDWDMIPVRVAPPID